MMANLIPTGPLFLEELVLKYLHSKIYDFKCKYLYSPIHGILFSEDVEAEMVSWDNIGSSMYSITAKEIN